MRGQAKKHRQPKEPFPALKPEKEALFRDQLRLIQTRLKEGAAPEEILALLDFPADEPDWDLRLLAALEKFPHPATPSLLAALVGPEPGKNRRKALSRSLHALKTKGVPVPEELLPRPAPTPVLQAPAPVFQAYLSPYLSPEEFFLALESDRRVLGPSNFLLCRVHEQSGLRECRLLFLNKQGRREFARQFLTGDLTGMVSLPPSSALLLLEEALAKTPPEDPERELYLGIREDLWRYLGPPPGEASLLELSPPLTEEERLRCLAESARLALHPLFRHWLPEPDLIEPWAQKIRDIRDSPLILSELQILGRLDTVLEEAARSLYPPEKRGLMARRLLLLSYILSQKGDLVAAKAARAASEDLSRGERSPLTGENPFLKELVAEAVKEGRRPERAREPSPLLVP